MLDYQDFFSRLEASSLRGHAESIAREIESALDPRRHGDLEQWLKQLDQLPTLDNAQYDLKNGVIVGQTNTIATSLKDQLETALRGLCPWRKGPFTIFDTTIDTEWHSDWKWDRLLPHIKPLQGKTVLDVGCGNGYHCWRMAGEEAAWVIGVDPSPRFVVQFFMIKKYLPDLAVDLLPLTLDTMPSDMQFFNTVFSMGVLYHRISPIEHIKQLKSCLKPGGELVLETLVVDGDETTCLIPEGRYACMRNVWFLPSVAMLLSWLNKLGFKNARCVDTNWTSLDEQRKTEWMSNHSLKEFLDPHNLKLTAEGHPAPQRAIILAEK
jgi:tRNA (mo5U34)-methyltransferase